MFGKRSASEAPPRTPPKAAATPASTRPLQLATVEAPPRTTPVPPLPDAGLKPSLALKVVADSRSDDYYQIKSTIFNALIDTIDLAQLAQLDSDSAREEIRDIV